MTNRTAAGTAYPFPATTRARVKHHGENYTGFMPVAAAIDMVNYYARPGAEIETGGVRDGLAIELEASAAR